MGNIGSKNEARVRKSPVMTRNAAGAGPLARTALPDQGTAKSRAQTVLVLQGGGALGAYQAGVFQALQEAGMELDWVIGTSIGAINAALITGNTPENRLGRLQAFWTRMRHEHPFSQWWSAFLGAAGMNLGIMARGLPNFFTPNPFAAFGIHQRFGADQPSFYSTEPLRETLTELVDFEYLNAGHTRLTVGAVNALTGNMRYFDSRHMRLTADHIMASGALPPAFPAVVIEGEPYWDGGIYSNTPVEVVFDDRPRLDSLIFSVNMWQPHGPAPETIWQVLGRQKEIQYSSRGLSHVARQQQLHRLRHVIRELAKKLPESQQGDAAIRELTSYGCGTTMHLIRLLAPRLGGEDHTKDIDFSPAGIEARWRAGYENAGRAIERRPWQCEVDPLQGVLIHEANEWDGERDGPAV